MERGDYILRYEENGVYYEIDEIVYDGELSTIQAIQNISESSIYGFEAGIQILLSNNLTFNSQYNYLKGVQSDNISSDLPVRHVSPHFGNAHLIFSNTKTKIDAFIEYNSELPFSNLSQSEIDKPYLYALDSQGNPFSPSWYTLNVRSFHEINDKLSLVATVENITNQLYRSYSSGISAPGINFIFSINYGI